MNTLEDVIFWKKLRMAPFVKGIFKKRTYVDMPYNVRATSVLALKRKRIEIASFSSIFPLEWNFTPLLKCI